jgi:hypothetical protein
MHTGALACRTLVTLTCLLATAGTCHATIIMGTSPTNTTTLQLPTQAATTNSIAGTDPTIGMFTFTSGNRLGSNAATDLITGALDFEDLNFRATNPGIIVGLSFQFSAPLSSPLQFAELVAFDQSGGSFHFTFPGPISGPITVSLLATGGETISGFSLSSPFLGPTIGPFRVATVPEPSTFAMGVAGAALAGLGWMRRQAVA